MKVATYEGFIEHGQIRMIGDVHLPENARVYVVVPGIETTRPAARIASPRLVRPEQAKDFEKQVFEEDDAGL